MDLRNFGKNAKYAALRLHQGSAGQRVRTATSGRQDPESRRVKETGKQGGEIKRTKFDTRTQDADGTVASFRVDKSHFQIEGII